MVTVSRLSERLRELSRAKGISQAQIADRASELGYSLGKGAISRYFNGKHGERPSNGTLTAFAKVFDVPVSDLIEAATFTGREPFAPDPSADRLTPPQRAVLNELIRVMTDANEKAGDGSEHSATSMSNAEGNSADSNVHQLHETPVYTEPPPASETAAKHGPNIGRSMKQAQDDDAERPDPDPNED